MTNITKKYGRIVAVTLLASVLITLVPAAINGFKVSASEMSSDDKKAAADISNTTGAKLEEILSLKQQGKSWNEILNLLKGRGNNSGDRDKRDDLLVNNGLEDDCVEKLKEEGFKIEEIMDAKLIVERVLFQLHEITGDSEQQVLQPKAGEELPGNSTDKSDISIAEFGDLAGKIDEDNAVTLMLKLQKDFGSLEKVLDEYLFTLQAGIDLQDYITDKKAYQKEKDEKSLAMDSEKIINMAKIEEKMLEKIQESNTKADQDMEQEPVPGTVTGGTVSNEDIPKPPLPDIKDVKPKDPAEGIMNEIKQINPLDK